MAGKGLNGWSQTITVLIALAGACFASAIWIDAKIQPAYDAIIALESRNRFNGWSRADMQAWTDRLEESAVHSVPSLPPLQERWQ